MFNFIRFFVKSIAFDVIYMYNAYQPVECGFITTGQGIKLTFELDKMDETLKQAIHFKTHKHDIIFYDSSNGKAFQLDKTGEYVCLGQFTYRFIGAN